MANFRKAVFYLAIPSCFSAVYSCSQGADEKEIEEITTVANSFAERYFNFDLNGSLPLCTPESRKWLAFAASNMTQEDVDLLNSQDGEAACETTYAELTSDTTATATCRIENFLKTDTLGRPGEMTDEADYNILLVKRNGRWLVKMEGLPRNEKRNRD